MKAFIVFACAIACAAAGPLLTPLVNSGAVSGPLTPAFGDLVATKRGLRPLSLEGFSEDVNQDGFVDPIAPAVAAAPAVYAAPTIAAPAIAPAAAISYTAAAPAIIGGSVIARPRLAQDALITGLPLLG